MSKDIITVLQSTMEARKIKVPKLASLLDIPKDRIYKWFQEGTKPKEADSVKLWEWINGGISDSMVNEPEMMYRTRTDHEKYVALLESTNRTLEKAIQLSLNAVLENQLLMKARMNATAEDVQDLLVDNGRKLNDVKEKTNKRMAAHLDALMKTGTAVGIPDRG